MKFSHLIKTAPKEIKEAAGSGDMLRTSELLREWAAGLTPRDGSQHRVERQQKRAAIFHADRIEGNEVEVISE